MIEERNLTGTGDARSVKPARSRKQIAALVAQALNAGAIEKRAMPPLIEGHIRDGMGRNWDVSVPARTTAQRAVIDGIRDTYDLA
jgi:hypothetical protein